MREMCHQYLPVSERQRRWGLYLVSCGTIRSRPFAVYPESGHPEGYSFQWEKGRRLEEYQLVYVAEGRGVFEVEGDSPKPVEAGCVLILRPGVWHRYKPEASTGWVEHWVGFGGDLAERVMEFAAAEPVIHLTEPSAYEVTVRELIARVLEDPMDRPFSNSGTLLELVGLVREGMAKGDDRRNGILVRRIQSYLLKHTGGAVDFEQLAADFHVGYSTLRRVFHQETGMALGQWYQDVLFRRAVRWLKATDWPVSEIAQKLGLESPEYFARFFRKKAGVSPREFRSRNR